MENMKYVIFNDHGKMIPILFANYLNHKKVAESLRNQIGKGDAEIISAGFVVLHDGKIKCMHESLSLDIKSRGEKDAKIIENFIS